MLVQHLQNYEDSFCELLALLCSIYCSSAKLYGTDHLHRRVSFIYWWELDGWWISNLAFQVDPNYWIRLRRARNWWTNLTNGIHSISHGFRRGLGPSIWLSSPSFVSWSVLGRVLCRQRSLLSPRITTRLKETRNWSRTYCCCQHRMAGAIKYFRDKRSKSSRRILPWETS